MAPFVYFIVLAWINIYVCREAFVRPATGHFNSMHGEWLALARLGSFGSWSPKWWPWWGAGVPFEYTYASLVPALTAYLSRVEHCSYELAFNQISGATYCLLPIVFYLVSWRLSGRPGYSFIAASVCSLLSPISLLLPDASFRWSLAGDARRLFLIFGWDDLPHIMSLALLPGAVWSLYRALTNGGWRFYWISALTMSAMMLANMFGAILAALVVVTVPWTLPEGTRLRSFANAAITAACAYVMVCSWLPPSLILTIRKNSILDGEAATTFVSMIALCVVAVAAANVRWLSARRTSLWAVRWLLVFGTIVLLIPTLDYYAGLHFVPQASRYKIEADLAIIWVVVFSVSWVVDRFSMSVRLLLVVTLVVLGSTQIVRYRRYAKVLLRDVNTPESIEYRAAEWTSQFRPWQRAMLGGSIGQWADAFVDVQQLGAQPYTTMPNFEDRLATFIINSGLGAADQDAAISILWMKAFGTQIIVVPGPASPEYWKPFANPAKFESVLRVLWRERDTTVYDVYSGAPANSGLRSFAHVLRAADLVQHTPVNGIDVTELQRYVSAIETGEATASAFRWLGTERAVIDARLSPGEVISVQVNFDKGWHARVNGQPARVRPDGLGLIVVESTCRGDCHVELTYQGSCELLSCRLASAGFSAFALAAAWWRRRSYHQRASRQS